MSGDPISCEQCMRDMLSGYGTFRNPAIQPISLIEIEDIKSRLSALETATAETVSVYADGIIDGMDRAKSICLLNGNAELADVIDYEISHYRKQATNLPAAPVKTWIQWNINQKVWLLFDDHTTGICGIRDIGMQAKTVIAWYPYDPNEPAPEAPEQEMK